MNRLRFATFVVAFACLSALGCASSNGEGAKTGDDAKSAESGKPGLADRDPDLAHKLVDEEGALLLDVRSQSEYDGGHAEGAKLIPHGEVPDRVAEIAEMQGGDKTKPIVIYCRSGHRAGIAKQSLLDAGFTNVTNVGGLSDYCPDC